MTDGVNNSRRRLLTGAVGVVGAAGVGMAAVPFIRAWLPSERAKALGAPVQADISALQPGQMLRFEWRGRPVWILSRTEEVLARLPEENVRLKDPDSAVAEQQPTYAQNATRAIRPEVFVVVGICTHLGCSPKFEPEVEPKAYDPQWAGGFFCPCHNSRFDLAGRVYAGVPAPTNLVVPPHRFVDDNTIIIGEDSLEA